MVEGRRGMISMKGKCLAATLLALTIIIGTLGINPAYSVAGVYPVSSFDVEPHSRDWVEPTHTIGETFDVAVVAYDVIELWGWSVGIRYNPAVINYTGYTWGDFENYAGGIIFPIEGTINYTTGETTAAWAQGTYGGTPVTLTSLLLITFHFKLVGYGNSTLDLMAAPFCKASNPTETYSGDTDFALNDGWINFSPAPIHDIAVTSVVPSATEVIVGDSVDIDITVENEGNIEESFTLNVYADAGLIGTEPATLAAGANGTYTFTWTTTDEGSFLIKAEVPLVSGEVDTADNVLEDGTVLVSPVPVHDVAVVSVSAPAEATQGDIVTISVDVTNLGDYDESFNIEVSYDTTSVGTQPVTLVSGNSTTVSLSWDTAGVTPATYTIMAEAILAGDADPTNNFDTATIKLNPVVFPVTVDGLEFNVVVESNSTVSNFDFRKGEMEISFSVDGPDGTVGFCNVIIPMGLMIGEPWLILVDGVETAYVQSDNGTHTFLYFTYTHTTHDIIIRGTWVVPEFPTGIPLLLVLAVLAVSTIILKRRTQKHPLTRRLRPYDEINRTAT